MKNNLLSTPLFAISVIIPLYNAESFIGDCLDSLLNQTFKNFEVILVDDCSTDNSVEIVESYAPKFDGRLKLTKMEKNTGSGSLPRNKGLLLSRGEYIFNMDNDDLITETALEEMYTLIKQYNVDFVYCDRYYSTDVNLENRFLTSFHADNDLVDEPTIVLPLLPECLDKIWVTPWTKLIKRQLLIENQIFFPNIIRDDSIWTWCLLFYSKRFLRVPNAVYIWRDVPDSITRSDKKPEQVINFWLNPVILGVKILDDRLQKIEFFQENPQERYALLEHFIHGSFTSRAMIKYRRQINPADIFKAIKEKFSESLGEYDVLIPALCSMLISEKIARDDADKANVEFQKFFTARVDITFSLKNGNDLRIVSVSDKKATVQKAIWLPEDKIGYFIQSRVGNMKIVAKVTSDGQISIDLKGMDIRNPEDKSKRIPYWIDYKKFTVNGKTIFDKITPVWHDKAYNYKLDLKAGEEIELQTEWLPHQSNVPVVATPKFEPPIVDKFLPYLTARLDIHFESEEGGDFQILSVSDDKAQVKKPAWLQKNGIDYVVQSHAGDMKIVAKATSDGQISVKLKGMDIRNPEDKSKRIPYWIDYKKFTVNGKTIFDKITPAWHDNIYTYKLDVEAGEEIELQTEWLPHQSNVPVVATPKFEPPIVDKFLPYLTARLDVHFESEEGGDFQILSVSDDKAQVKKPAWLQKNGIDYVVQSHAGDMKIVAKATSDGQISVKLKGMDIRNPEDKSKRIPYWIDYTKLVIDGKIIFDKITPAWHDKVFNYKLDVEADEEIELQTEWLPHQSNVPVVAPPKVEPPIVDKFLPYLTARLDVHFESEDDGDFQILSVSDDKAQVKKPAWLQKNGVGYIIQSHAGDMKIVAKATSDGQISVKLKGMDIRNPEDKSKRIPYWIDYKKLVIDGKTIFDKITPAWHDKVFSYKLDVEADEEIKLQTEWLPHRSDT